SFLGEDQKGRRLVDAGRSGSDESKSPLLIACDIAGCGHTVIPATHQLINAMVNVLLEEVNRTVGETEIGAARMVRFETPGDIPVVKHVQQVAGIAPVTGAAEVVDRDNRRGMCIAAVVTPPIILCQMVVFGRFG